jgi:hypothetical protein
MMGTLPILVFSAFLMFSATGHYIEVNITVPQFSVFGSDSYLCAAVELAPTPHKLVAVVPRASQNVVHHILLYGEFFTLVWSTIIYLRL